MNTETKEKKPYVAPELTVVTLDRKFDLLQDSGCAGWDCIDENEGEFGSIPVIIDDRGMVKV
jgi:hypothetical protein